MRHVFGIVLAAATAAALFFGAGWGVARITALHSQGVSLTSTHALIAVAVAVGTGAGGDDYVDIPAGIGLMR